MIRKLQFSQSSLQDYQDCARRFELRYLKQVKWPAVETEPMLEFERHMHQGEAFHRLVEQHLIGIPVDRLKISDEPLCKWWNNYLKHGLIGLPNERQAEVTLYAPVDGYRLIAKYDLLAFEAGGRFVIMDWKTSQRRVKRERLAERLQTIVYPYVLVEAGASLNGGKPLQPEQVEMVYWFAEFPEQPERFVYDTVQYERDKATLNGLVREIEARTVFELTSDLKKCEFCTYRSLCQRGVRAGNWREVEDQGIEVDDLDFDFDQIAEIEF